MRTSFSLTSEKSKEILCDFFSCIFYKQVSNKRRLAFLGQLSASLFSVLFLIKDNLLFS